MVSPVLAHSVNDVGVRHGLADHVRSTAELAASFAAPFGARELAWALGLWHDAGKAECSWQERLLLAERTDGPVGGDHKSLGARMLLPAASVYAMAVAGHHGGLEDRQQVARLAPQPGDDDTLARFYSEVPEARRVLDAENLIPAPWRRDPLVAEMGLRLVFSALVDADHLDTAAHFAGLPRAKVTAQADMAGLLRRFEERRAGLLAARPESPIDGVRSELYESVVKQAGGAPGVYRLPAPTGSGKTLTAAGFALHHAVANGQRRVIVAVPFITITEQNAAVYRRLLGADVVLEHHSQVEFDQRWSRLGAENWDAPFVMTTMVQLFDSLFGRKPARSRKLHRLAGAVIVLDEVQALPLTLLVPILDALKVLTTHFGTTVLLTSATQPAFDDLAVWRDREVVDLVDQPATLFERLRRVSYEWWLDPRPTLAEVAERAGAEHQALVVVNTVDQARTVHRLISGCASGAVLHLSTRMCPAHRRQVLEQVQQLLAAGDRVVLISTQLIEAGVDLDFPVVFRALSPAEALQQAAGRANREGKQDHPGRMIVFDAADTRIPGFYSTAVGSTRAYFGPDKQDPDDVDALRAYYQHLYRSLNLEQGARATAIQRHRKAFDFRSVADGPVSDGGVGQRDRALAFRMLDDDTVPVVVSTHVDQNVVNTLLDRARADQGANREVWRKLQPYTVSLPQRVMDDPGIQALCRPVLEGLWEWAGPYDECVGIDEGEIGKECVW